jgi:hypothetical protein
VVRDTPVGHLGFQPFVEGAGAGRCAGMAGDSGFQLVCQKITKLDFSLCQG